MPFLLYYGCNSGSGGSGCGGGDDDDNDNQSEGNEDQKLPAVDYQEMALQLHEVQALKEENKLFRR